MVALTAVRNPLKPKQSLLFYCSDDSQVALNTKTDDAGGNDRCGPTDPNQRPPQCNPGNEPIGALVRRPGAFASLNYENLVRVYGIRVDRRVSQLSPAVEKLSKDPHTNSTALAACGDQDNGWLYYFSMDQTPKLAEYSLNDGAETTRLIPRQDIIPGPETSLCAYYDPDTENRCCAYQSSQGALMYYEAGPKSPTTGLITPTNASFKTPMAAVLAKTTPYVYFLTTDLFLGRVRRNPDNSWSDIVMLRGSGGWLVDKPLAATASADGSFVKIWQQTNTTEDKNKFKEFKDNLKQQAS